MGGWFLLLNSFSLDLGWALTCNTLMLLNFWRIELFGYGYGTGKVAVRSNLEDFLVKSLRHLAPETLWWVITDVSYLL